MAITFPLISLLNFVQGHQKKDVCCTEINKFGVTEYKTVGSILSVSDTH
jgi:hypothetical protein